MNESNTLPYGSRLEGNPDHVLLDQSLDDRQKIAVLEDWLQDLLELQTATGENMASNDNELGEVARQYQRVNDALRLAREPSDTDRQAVAS